MSDDVTVTQADRDAAAEVVKSYRENKNGNWKDRIREGRCDDGEMVQAFARHRLAAERAAVDRIAALEAILRETRTYIDTRWSMNPELAARIDALLNPTDQEPDNA